MCKLQELESRGVGKSTSTCCGMLLATPWQPAESIRTLQAFMGHRSIANTVVYTAVADKRIRNIWGK